jgi:hypothetical protein
MEKLTSCYAYNFFIIIMMVIDDDEKDYDDND